MSEQNREFTPALGKHELTGNYDQVVEVMTRERRWRGLMLKEFAPQPDQTVLDIGAGTGSFAILVKQACAEAIVIAVDPDPEVRIIAEQKAHAANVQIEFITAMGGDQFDGIESGSIDCVTCSLVLHQCPGEVKIGILANAYRLLKPEGRLLISDYGKQRSALMSMLFNQVRMIDGYEDTKANKDGLVPLMMSDAGFKNVSELKVTQTPTGSISLYAGQKPD